MTLQGIRFVCVKSDKMNMFEIKNFPDAIQKRIKNQPYKNDNIGESGSLILIFENMVLKIEPTSCQANNEYEVLKWLQGKLPVPEIIEFERADNYNYLLMSKLDGTMACDEINLKNPEMIVEALADGLKQLWRIDIDNCPYCNRLDKRLKDADYNIEHNLVDVDDFNDDTLGENGFKDVDELYDFLLKNKPPEDLVFTHGDYCLPNIFIGKDKADGFLDLGKAGIADRWQDIALCVRSLKYNVCDLCGLSNDVYLKLKNKLYSLLEITEDKEKLRYYILLDELF